MPRTFAPFIVLALVFAGCTGTGAAAQPSPTVSAPPARPTVAFTLDGGYGKWSYRNDAASSLDLCTHNADGSWRLLYAGGDPWFTIDMLVGAQAAEAAHADQVAVEIETPGTYYIRLDPAPIRLGDVPGRSTATVKVTAGATTTSFDVVATTPDHSSGEDAGPVEVTVSAVCPN